MPLHMPFNFPYFYNNYNRKYSPLEHSQNQVPNQSSKIENASTLKASENNENFSEAPECLFEFFGLKLYFDDLLIICILIFLYKEDVRDEELFLCLMLLLLS